jgi:hypothetical protein
MGPLTQDDSDTRELVTETLDEARMRGALSVIVQNLLCKGVENVRVDFGFVLKRDLQGKPQYQPVRGRYGRLFSVSPTRSSRFNVRTAAKHGSSHYAACLVV